MMPMFVNTTNLNTQYNEETTHKKSDLNFTDIILINYDGSANTFKHSFPFFIKSYKDEHYLEFESDANVLDQKLYPTMEVEDRIKTVENDVTIDVKNLSPGMYKIKISNGKNSSSTTWIKKQFYSKNLN